VPSLGLNTNLDEQLSIRTPNHDTLCVNPSDYASLSQSRCFPWLRFLFSTFVYVHSVSVLVLNDVCFHYLTCRHWMISSKTNVRFIRTVSPHGSSLLHRPRSFNPRASPSTHTLPFQCPLTTTAPSIPIHCHLFPRYTTLWSVLTFHSPLLFSVRPQRYITDDAARVHVYRLSQNR